MNRRPDRNPAEDVEESPGFVGIAWRRLKRDRYAMTGFYIIMVLFAVAYLTPVLANNKPIVMRFEDRLYFPAVAELFPFNHVLRYPELRTLDFAKIRSDESIAQLRAPIPSTLSISVLISV